MEHKDIQVTNTLGTKDVTPIADILKYKISNDTGATISVMIMIIKKFRNMLKSGEITTSLIGIRVNKNIILSRETVLAMMDEGCFGSKSSYLQ